MSTEKGVLEVDRCALLKHAERVSAELAVVHAHLREREQGVEKTEQRAAAAMHAAQEAEAATRVHRCAQIIPFLFGTLVADQASSDCVLRQFGCYC
jgi:hypothetical protein